MGGVIHARAAQVQHHRGDVAAGRGRGVDDVVVPGVGAAHRNALDIDGVRAHILAAVVGGGIGVGQVIARQAIASQGHQCGGIAVVDLVAADGTDRQVALGDIRRGGAVGENVVAGIRTGDAHGAGHRLAGANVLVTEVAGRRTGQADVVTCDQAAGQRTIGIHKGCIAERVAGGAVVDLVAGIEGGRQRTRRNGEFGAVQLIVAGEVATRTVGQDQRSQRNALAVANVLVRRGARTR